MTGGREGSRSAGRDASPGSQEGHRAPAPRILFVSYTASRTGPTNSLSLILEHLPGEWSPLVLTPGEGAFTEELTGMGVEWRTLPHLGWGAIRSIVTLLRRESIDLVYGNSSHGSSRNALIAAKLAGVPSICHVREMGGHKSWAQMGFLRLAREVIAVSDACGRSISRFVWSGRLHVVHNGVPLREQEPAPSRRGAVRNEVRQELGLPGSVPIVLCLGHVCRRKGQRHAVLALSRVEDRGLSSHLALVGGLDREPGYVADLEDEIERLGLAGSVSVLGFRTDTDELLLASDIAVHTALSDPHPRAVLEAMASGLPVVAFDVDGVSETVVDGETGALVPAGDTAGLADALAEMLGDADARRALGLAGRARVEARFTARETAAGVEAVIRRALRGIGSSAAVPGRPADRGVAAGREKP